MNVAKIAAAVFGVALIVSPAAAQDMPPIRIIVGFSAGGVTDVLARVFAEDLRKRLNTTVIVENKPGASGTIATAMVSKLPPDGTTLIMIPGTHTMVPSIQKVDFDTKTALTYISLIATAPSMLTVNKNTAYKDVKSVVDDAKARPGEIAYGSSGVGSTSHFMGLLFEREAKVKLNHIPFKSSGEIPPGRDGRTRSDVLLGGQSGARRRQIRRCPCLGDRLGEAIGLSSGCSDIR